VLALAAAALAAPTLDVSPGKRVAPSERVLELAAGAGAAFFVGPTGSGYDAAVAQRASMSLLLGKASGVGLAITHGEHVLLDPTALAGVPGAPITGRRDWLGIQAAARIGFDVRTGRPRESGVAAFPWIDLAAGVALSSTELTAPTTTGSTSFLSRGVHPALGIGAGCEVRLLPWFSLHPGIHADLAIVEDRGPVGGETVILAEGRIAPVLELALAL
jgi:hypothetical protein